MVTEKLSKAYFWRTGKPPSKNHAGFVQFLRSLLGIEFKRREQVASQLTFGSFQHLRSWIPNGLQWAYAIESLAPSLARDGPNPEYPWPRADPTDCPANFAFPLWKRLTATGNGRQFVSFIEAAIVHFPAYA